VATGKDPVALTLHRAAVLFSSGTGGMVSILKEADANLSKRLHGIVKKKGTDATFTEAQAHLFRKQIQLVTEYLEKRLVGHTHEQAMLAVAKGVASTTRLAKKLEQKFTGIARPLAIDSVAMQDAITRGAGASLLRQHVSSVSRYGKGMIADFERVMRVAALEGLSQHQVVSRLVAAGELGGINAKSLHAKEPRSFPEPTSYLRRRYWAERILRTETSYAYNSAGLATIQAAQVNDFPDMQKKILATFDPRTAPDSVAVHGQIRKVSEMFVDGAGRHYLHPPARPNDREAVIPWRPAWKETTTTEQASIEEQIKAQEALFTEEKKKEAKAKAKAKRAAEKAAKAKAAADAKEASLKAAKEAAEKAEAEAKAKAVLERAQKAAEFKAKMEARAAAKAAAAQLAAQRAAAQAAAAEARKRELEALANSRVPEPDAEGFTALGDLEQIGGQLGSNPGALYKDRRGTQWYVKPTDNEDRARDEVLSAKLYEAAGINVPDVRLIRMGDKLAVASKFDQGAKKLDGSFNQKDAFDGFGADAWLANWDVVGKGGSNLMIGSDGRLLRLDTGGALRFRAQGAIKPGWEKGAAGAGSNVTELTTMRAGSYDAAQLYGQASSEQIIAALKRVEKVSSYKVREAVETYGPRKPEEQKEMLTRLLDRKTKIREHRKELEAALKAQAEALANPQLHLQRARDAASKLKHPDMAGVKAIVGALPVEKLQQKPWNEKAADARAEKLRVVGTTTKVGTLGALRSFTGSGYPSIRSSERMGAPNSSSDSIHSLLQSAEAEPANELLYRGIQSDPAAVAELLKRDVIKLGVDWGDGTTSTSKTLSTALSFGGAAGQANGDVWSMISHGRVSVLMRIKNARGAYIGPISAMGHEKEVLQPRDAEFRVTNVFRGMNDSTLIVDLEGLP
jgi:hypothetical protein